MLLVCVLSSISFTGNLLAGSEYHPNDSAENIAEKHHHSGKKHRKYRKLMEKLDLTQEQRESFKAIKERNKKQIIANRSSMKTLKKKIKRLLKAEVIDEPAVREFSAQMAELKTDNMILHAREKKEMLTLLTNEQKEKLEQMKQRRQEKRQQRRNARRDKN